MTAPAPSFTAAGQSAVQPRNNSFGNNSDCFRSRSSRRGQGAAVALGTSPFPFQPTPFIQINNAHFAVSVVPSFVAGQRTNGELEGLIAEAQDLLAALQKRREAKGIKNV